MSPNDYDPNTKEPPVSELPTDGLANPEPRRDGGSSSKPLESDRTETDRGQVEKKSSPSEDRQSKGIDPENPDQSRPNQPNYLTFDLETWCEEKFEEVCPLADGSFRVTCPSHGDGTPSLHVSIGENEAILLHCFAGCKTEAILEAALLEWKDLYPEGEVLDRGVVQKASKQHSDPDLVHEVYQELIHNLELFAEDREHLRSRGLSDEAITRNQYRSLSFQALVSPLDQLYRKHGPRLLKVPGFYRTRGKDGNYRDFELIRLNQEKGILIPVRTSSGKIMACQVRTSDPDRKYVWLSSRGASAVTEPHVPLGIAGPCPVLRITEGILKADVVMCLDSSVPCIGVGGVSVWAKALPVLKEIGAQTVRLAFDADSTTKENVAQAVQQCGQRLLSDGYRVEIEEWDMEGGKGLDDLLNSGGTSRSTLFRPTGSAPSPSKASREPARSPSRVTGVTQNERHGRKGSSWGAFPPPVPISHLENSPHNQVEWILNGLIPKGGMTQLIGLWKAGKTTLLLHMLEAMSKGHPEFCGLSLSPGRVLLVTQENDGIWNRRREQHGLSDRVVFLQRGPEDYPQPFRLRPSTAEWICFVDHLIETNRNTPFDLIVIDALADFWPVEDENSASQVTAALLPLRQLTQGGAGVLLLHHPSKKGGSHGTGSRGSGALPSVVEVILECRWGTGNKRVITTLSRYEETPARLTVELTDSGYVRVREGKTEAVEQDDDDVELILHSLPDSPPGITSGQLHETLTKQGMELSKDQLRRRLSKLRDGARVLFAKQGNSSTYFYYSKPLDSRSGVPTA